MADIKNNKTAWQNLNTFLGLEASGNFDKNQPSKVQKIIIRGNTPQEIERKNLELQQQQALRSKWIRTNDHGFKKAMQYEAHRLPAYLDYEGMEYYPLIASALDLFMEETTTIGETGKMLNIYSDKERIKTHLEELFYDIIDININLPFWTRAMCKYGDNFVYMLGEKKKGITVVKQMVNYEMERIEKVENGKLTTKFKQRVTGDEYNNFEIAHFRLLGDDKYLPYGSSILNKIRRVFRQLIMAEDAMLTYRIIRAGEKRVFKIDVGNIDEDDIESYVQRVIEKFKKTQQIDYNSGQIDYRFNIVTNDEDYVIPVRNANVQTGIDTLPGAENLDKIHDIEYLRDNLFTGLGVPKPFLGYQATAGEGKNLAQMDIRFAKKINRIQQALIQELNKMAIIHLYLLGFSAEDLGNFTLSLTNPSTQQEMLKSELLQLKAQVYTELTRSEGGIAAMSHTEAKRKIFNMSDREIIDDLKKQFMERSVSQELQDAPLVIRQSGLFSDLNDIYGTGELPPATGGTEQGGELDNLGGGGEGAPESNLPPVGGGGPNAPQSPAELPPVIGQGKGFKDNKKPMISEKNYTTYSMKFNNFVHEMVSGKKEDEVKEIKTIIKETENKNNELNRTANEMTNEIDKILKKSDSINTKQTLDIRNFNAISSKDDDIFDIYKLKIEDMKKDDDLKGN